MNTDKMSIALVTGAYRGLGLETVKLLARRGYHVVLTARKKDIGERVVEELISEGLSVSFELLDINSQQSIDLLFRAIQRQYGRLDVLINNAAIHYNPNEKAFYPDFGFVQETLETNLMGAWKLIVALLPLLRNSNRPVIVNVSSESGSLSSMGGGMTSYAITKASLNVLTIKLAAELKPEGILVNAVCPGWVKTEMGGPNAPREVEEGAKSIVWAATLGPDGPTGGFFRDAKPLPW